MSEGTVYLKITPDTEVFERSMRALRESLRAQLVADVRKAVVRAGKVEMGRRWSRRWPGLDDWQRIWLNRMLVDTSPVPSIFTRLPERRGK